MSAPAIARQEDHPYVAHQPGVQGGRAVIRGSRFPVRSIVQSYRSGYTVEEILREFPQLSPAEVHDALSYYYDHRSEIEDDIRQMEDLDAAMAEVPPTLLPR